MKKTFLLILILTSILSCKNNSFNNWEKNENGYYQKTIFPYKYDWKRIDQVLTLTDTLNGTFEVYDENGNLHHKGEFKEGKIYGNLYEYDNKERLKEYSFIWEDCGECHDLPPAHYILEYDSIGKQKDYSGKAIIEWNVEQSEIRLADSLEINILLATPPFFRTELVIKDKDSNTEIMFLSNPENENKIKIRFDSMGKKRLKIQYALAQEDSPTGMISTINIENIIVTE